ncbi:MAG: thioredoxin domain-containing protein [Gemmatimonadaceae bacterium]
MPNRLANETSPYLLQHAGNPVDWYAWNDAALERAKAENRPILLSIGYSACHWCHVMEHESFEDPETARLMNEHFVNIKVDREERPDLDGIYMQAVQAMTGHGGWPMTVFLTPRGEPFYGGTYFPPDDRHGMPAFRRVLLAVAGAYRERPGDVARTAERMRAIYTASMAEHGTAVLDAPLLDRCYRALATGYDKRNGGFGGAPKFPQTMALDFCLRHWRRTGNREALDIALDSFRRMAGGGVYDQVGGGFHRYAVDAEWLVPHFEKMLYDNALLIRLGVHLWQATGDPAVRRVVEETVQWVAREMTDASGGFYSSLDADSEGVEGRFYVWDEAELEELLGDDSPTVKAHWGVTSSGNFEGRNILQVSTSGTRDLDSASHGDDRRSPESPIDSDARDSDARDSDVRDSDVRDSDVREAIARARIILYDRRASRVWPARDDKILASWNGLMLRAIAEAARVFERGDYRALALANATFLWNTLVRDNRVLRSYRDGATRVSGFLEDHAAIALGLITLYQLTFDPIWLDRARTLGATIDRWFRAEDTGSFFDTASDAEALITRPRELTDNATPSGSSLAAELQLLLAEYDGDEARRERGSAVIVSLADAMSRYPMAFGHALGVADMLVNGAVEVAIAGEVESEEFRSLAAVVARSYVPSLVLAGGAGSAGGGSSLGDVRIALLEGRRARDGRATAYVCRRYVCDEPVEEPAALEHQLERAVGAGTADRNDLIHARHIVTGTE